MIADRHLDDLPDTPPNLAGSRFSDWAAFLTDELILIALSAVDLPDDGEEHLLLSARSLRCRSRIRYPMLHSPGSTRGAEYLSRLEDVVRQTLAEYGDGRPTIRRCCPLCVGELSAGTAAAGWRPSLGSLWRLSRAVLPAVSSSPRTATPQPPGRPMAPRRPTPPSPFRWSRMDPVQGCQLPR